MGQYDPSKAINLGSNRWSVKPDIGFSKSFESLTVDLTVGATLLSNNDDFFGGQAVIRTPIYSTQANLSYISAAGSGPAGGHLLRRWTHHGQRRAIDDALSNSRVGIDRRLPVDRYYSIKFNASSGISTRTGSNFDTVGMLWQYRWGAGL